MNTMWCDTETTGINTDDSGAFEIALLFAKNGKVSDERIFHLNPLTETIIYHEDAGKIHLISEDEIRSYPSPEKIIPNIVEFFKKAISEWGDGEKMIFAGYNCNFDWQHVQALFTRCGFNLSDYFCKQFDALELVRLAEAQKVLPWLENLKLGTVCKSLGVNLDNAHSAICDIRATRDVCVQLYRKGVKL